MRNFVEFAATCFALIAAAIFAEPAQAADSRTAAMMAEMSGDVAQILETVMNEKIEELVEEPDESGMTAGRAREAEKLNEAEGEPDRYADAENANA